MPSLKFSVYRAPTQNGHYYEFHLGEEGFPSAPLSFNGEKMVLVASDFVPVGLTRSVKENFKQARMAGHAEYSISGSIARESPNFFPQKNLEQEVNGLAHLLVYECVKDLRRQGITKVSTPTPRNIHFKRQLELGELDIRAGTALPIDQWVMRLNKAKNLAAKTLRTK